MQITSRFTIAIHIFACIEVFEKDYKITSNFLATSVNVNPVIIRQIILQLKSAGLISVARGTGGASITRPLDEITFFDVYKAVEAVENEKLFSFHENPSSICPVGRNIHNVLDTKLDVVQKAMEDKMREITLKKVVEDTRFYIEKESKNR